MMKRNERSEKDRNLREQFAGVHSWNIIRAHGIYGISLVGGLKAAGWGLGVFIYFTSCAGICRAESAPAIAWNKTHAGQATGIVVDNSGSVYVTGIFQKAVGYNWRTIKYDTNGNEVWSVIYESAPSGVDYAAGIAVDSSGSVYVTGYNAGATNDFRTIKYDASGNIVWNKTYDSGNSDQARGIAVDGSGNVCVTGLSLGSSMDCRTIKYDSGGNIVWNKLFDSGDQDWAKGIAVDGAGNVYVTGNVNALTLPFQGDCLTIKYDSAGNSVWTRTFDGGGKAAGMAVVVDGSGSVCVTGSWNQGGMSLLPANSLAIKYDSSGNIIWNRLYWGGVETTSGGGAGGIAVDGSGNVYITGQVDNSLLGGNGLDFATMKLNGSGNGLWSTLYDSGISDVGKGIAVDSFGNVYVAGNSSDGGSVSESHIIKYGTNTIVVPPSSPATGDSTQPPAARDTSVIPSPSSATGDNLEAGKVKIVSGIRGYINTKRGEQATILVRPNTSGTIRVRIYDDEGRFVKELTAEADGQNKNAIQWDGTDSSGRPVGPGAYPIFVEAPGIRFKNRLVVAR
jgi:hypothetical protein